jgi:hypothetical protein
MANVTVSDSTYTRLAAAAAARMLSLEAYLGAIATDVEMPSSDSMRHLAVFESFAAGMTSWSPTHLPLGHVVDDSRERICEGRCE